LIWRRLLKRFRRILVRWEKRADIYVALLRLVFTLITWRACPARLKTSA
jgi:hypothetical protein